MPLGMLGRGLVPTPPLTDGGYDWAFRGTGVQLVKQVLNFEVEPRGAVGQPHPVIKSNVLSPKSVRNAPKELKLVKQGLVGQCSRCIFGSDAQARHLQPAFMPGTSQNITRVALAIRPPSTVRFVEALNKLPSVSAELWRGAWLPPETSADDFGLRWPAKETLSLIEANDEVKFSWRPGPWNAL